MSHDAPKPPEAHVPALAHLHQTPQRDHYESVPPTREHDFASDAGVVVEVTVRVAFEVTVVVAQVSGNNRVCVIVFCVAVTVRTVAFVEPDTTVTVGVTVVVLTCLQGRI